MGHLTPGELVDLAEGARDDASIPHLSNCAACRRQLADLRMMVDVGDLKAAGAVPEPSPLFWDHLSARVHDSVRLEDVPARPSRVRFWPRFTVAAMGMVVVTAIVAGLGSRLVAPGSPVAVAPAPGSPVDAVQDVQVALPALPGSADDPSLTLVADYGGTLDWDELREQMAVSPHTAGMDATAGELSADERLELRRLLREELARPAARTDRS